MIKEKTELDRLAYKQYKLSRLLKKLDVVKKQIRAELFQEADEHFEKEHWHLPMTSWLVEWDFFEKSGITPEVDWETMEKVEPEFFKMFAKPVQTYELDAEAFNKYMNKHPEFPGAQFLMKYSMHKSPTLRVLAKQKKKDE